MALHNFNNLENQLRLKGRMPTLHWPRFRPTGADTTGFAWWLLANCLYVVVISLGLDAFRAFLLLPFFAFIPDIIRWMRRYSEGLWFFPKLRFLVLPFTAVWAFGILLPVLADHVSPPLWFAAVIFVLAWRMVRLSQKIRSHYLDYCLEHEALSDATRAKWNLCRENNWGAAGAAACPASRLSTQEEVRRFSAAVADLRSSPTSELLVCGSGLAGSLLAMQVLSGLHGQQLRGNAGMFFVAFGIVGVTAVPAAVRLLRAPSAKEELDAAWHALHAFCHSPPTVPLGSRAPWSARSRFGDAENRRSYLLWNALLIGFLLISAVVLYPLLGSHAPGESEFSYPLTGSAAFARLIQLRFDATTPGWVFCGYFAAALLATPIFIGCGLAALVGPTASAAQVLFEGDDALEHERQSMATSGTTVPSPRA